MTIAVSLKVNDGVVLAADSASAFLGRDPAGHVGVINVYNNANKIFNLCKGLPVGGMTWGSGGIGNASISTLAKDLRACLSGNGADHSDWKLDPDHFTVQEVAQRLHTFMYKERYVHEFKEWKEKPSLGFMVAGYTPGQSMAEEYRIEIVNGECKGPEPVRPVADVGLTWKGEPEAIHRLVWGYSTGLPEVLHAKLGVPKEQVTPALKVLRQTLRAPFVNPAMPFQDAIDLAEFLVDLTIRFHRFMPGAPTVGGPIEVAAISKHEGFKWIRRKYYYQRELNPEPD